MFCCFVYVGFNGLNVPKINCCSIFYSTWSSVAKPMRINIGLCLIDLYATIELSSSFGCISYCLWPDVTATCPLLPLCICNLAVWVLFCNWLSELPWFPLQHCITPWNQSSNTNQGPGNTRHLLASESGKLSPFAQLASVSLAWGIYLALLVIWLWLKLLIVLC